MGVKLFPLLKMALLWKRLSETLSEHFIEATGEYNKQGVGSLKPYFDEMNQTSWYPIQHKESYPYHTVVACSIVHCRALFISMMKICCTLCHCHIPWSQNGVLTPRTGRTSFLGGQPGLGAHQRSSGKSSGGNLGVGSQLEGACFRPQLGRTWCCACLL